MLGRVTQGTILRDLQTQIERLQRGLLRAQETVSSQKKLRRASDDPSATARVNRLRGEATEIQALRQGVGFATAALAAADGALDSALSIVTRAREIAAQHAGGLSSVAARHAAAEEIAELERAMIALGNTAITGRHVFGGLATGAPPFTALDAPEFDPATAYTGPADPFFIPTGAGQTTRITTPGGQVFGPALTALDELRVTLAAGEAPVASLDALGVAADTLGDERTSVGARLSRLTDRDRELHAVLDGARIMLADLEDADLAVAAIDLLQLQNALQATLAAGSRLMQTSILDFVDF